MSAHLIENRNRRVGVIFALVAALMLALGYAAVPLYRMFCQVTGFGGTTQRVTEAEASKVFVTPDLMSIRFDANTERGMPWNFRAEQATDSVAIGARDMAVFLATNESDRPITGTASFNVSPVQAGKYFNKIQCFCFTDQTLRPGQEMRMPVLYYVDPAILDDPDTRDLKQITLSYTFYQHDEEQGPGSVE